MLIISDSSKGGGREKSVEKRGLRRKNEWENQRKGKIESYKSKHNYHFSLKVVLVPVSLSTEWWND